jgi:hypothetical protein
MLVSTEPGGLGNRIKSWVSARRLDPDARVFWPATANMPAAFNELFANDCAIDQPPRDATEHCSWRLAILPEDVASLPEGFAVAGAGRHPLVRRVGKLWWNFRGQPDDRYRYMVLPKRFSRQSMRRDGRNIDFEYGRIPEQLRNVYVPLFSEVAVRPEVIEALEAWEGSRFDDDIVGVQVRTWRDDPRRHRKHHRPAVGRLKQLLNSVASDRRFFVVSDDDDVIPWLASLVGKTRVVAFPRETRRLASWQSTQGMVEDLIDMVLLSRANELFASYLSTFSETAWWLGGARARVSVF